MTIYAGTSAARSGTVRFPHGHMDKNNTAFQTGFRFKGKSEHLKSEHLKVDSGVMADSTESEPPPALTSCGCQVYAPSLQ